MGERGAGGDRKREYRKAREMRWSTPHDGDRRVVRKFLWWKTVINHEARWLEFAYIEQVFEEGRYVDHWYNERWSTLGTYAIYKDGVSGASHRGETI